MLCLYFLKKFYKNFFLFFIILTFIFGGSDLFIRLPLITITAVPKLLFLMFPLMSLFAIPFASALSVQMVCGNLHIDDEILFFYFFSSARKVLHKAVLIFSVSILFFYIPLIFVFVPKSYKMGKKFILNLAKERIYQLEPQKFHSPFPGFTLFFKKKKIIDNSLEFEKLLLMFSEKKGDKYLVNAQIGFLQGNTLFLEDGVIQNIESKKHYFATFKKSEINLNKFFDVEKENGNIRHIKFFTLKDLRNAISNMPEAFIEYYKRIAQIIWQFLFPFLAFWGIMIFGRKKSNLLVSVAWSGVLFLFSYMSLNIAQAFYKDKWLSLFLLFIPIFLITTIIYLFYKKKQ